MALPGKVIPISSPPCQESGMRNALFLAVGLLPSRAPCNSGTPPATTDAAAAVAATTPPDLMAPPAAPDAGVDAGDNGAPSTNYPAPFPAPPQVVTGRGP